MVSTFLLYGEHAVKSIYLNVHILTATITKLTLLRSCFLLNPSTIAMHPYLSNTVKWQKDRRAVAGQLSWLECRPDTPMLGVPSLVGVHLGGEATDQCFPLTLMFPSPSLFHTL